MKNVRIVRSNKCCGYFSSFLLFGSHTVADMHIISKVMIIISTDETRAYVQPSECVSVCYSQLLHRITYLFHKKKRASVIDFLLCCIERRRRRKKMSWNRSKSRSQSVCVEDGRDVHVYMYISHTLTFIFIQNTRTNDHHWYGLNIEINELNRYERSTISFSPFFSIELKHIHHTHTLYYRSMEWASKSHLQSLKTIHWFIHACHWSEWITVALVFTQAKLTHCDLKWIFIIHVASRWQMLCTCVERKRRVSGRVKRKPIKLRSV